jgi:hypothetical protein
VVHVFNQLDIHHTLTTACNPVAERAHQEVKGLLQARLIAPDCPRRIPWDPQVGTRNFF